MAEGGCFTRLSQWSAVADFRIDGRRLGAEPYRVASRSRHETRLEQKQSETFLTAHALAHLGYRDVVLVAREAPDFCAILPPSTESIGIEHAELVAPDSARWRNAIENIRIAVRDKVDADAGLQAAIRGRYISFSFWYCPNRSAERRVVCEITELLRNDANDREHHGERIFDGARFPTLFEHGAHLHVTKFAGASVDVSAGAHSFDPRSISDVALKVLERKRKTARKYGMIAPLWLILSVTDQRGVFGDSLEFLDRLRHIEIEPYERVVVYHESRAVIWNRDGLRRTG